MLRGGSIAHHNNKYLQVRGQTEEWIDVNQVSSGVTGAGMYVLRTMRPSLPSRFNRLPEERARGDYVEFAAC